MVVHWDMRAAVPGRAVGVVVVREEWGGAVPGRVVRRDPDGSEVRDG
ncbi:MULTISPECIES: hypothetical protein [unclassified Crossiella]|nr:MULTISPECIES: hypothetical protein [unclassified Crossiella]MCK2239419.1 hypothetical protein [Crossiella sp. S99.2]MCK2252114.1 hypothetical protein [Crossiella sp. S99.1]